MAGTCQTRDGKANYMPPQAHLGSNITIKERRNDVRASQRNPKNATIKAVFFFAKNIVG